MKKMVFFVSNGLSGGGAERVMSVIANWLDNNGFLVSFIMLKNVSEDYILNSNIKRYYRQTIKKKDFLGEILYIRSFTKKYPNSTFISFFTYQSIYTILAAIGTKARIIVSERNDPSKTVKGIIQRVIRNIAYCSNKCNVIVFQSEGAKKYFNTTIQNKSVVIMNPIRSDLPKRVIDGDAKTIVAVGRLDKQKNYPLLLNSFASFLRTHRDYKLVIYGQGELKNELQNLTNNLHIEKNVTFAGFKNNIHECINNASMFVMTSDYEGLSNALLEAMAIGIPCISTNSPPGGAEAIINDHINGILVPVGNSDALVNAMCYLADNSDVANKMGFAATKIREILSESKICKLWQDLVLS